MLTHLVMFRFDDDDAAEEAVRRLSALPAQIQAIQDLEVGRNVQPSERSFDVGLIVRLDDLDGLSAYREHPAHQEVVAFLRAHATATAAVDLLTT